MLSAYNCNLVRPGICKGLLSIFRSSITLNRLISKAACASQQCGSPGGGSSKHQITYKSYVAPCYKDHDAKNMEMRRPMSPHLSIYAPTVPAMTSIAQRITGVIVSFYALIVSGSTLFLSNGIDSLVSMVQSLDFSRPSLFIIKIIVGAPFAYHYFCGIKFCGFNMGKWLDLKSAYEIARYTFIGTAVITLLFALL